MKRTIKMLLIAVTMLAVSCTEQKTTKVVMETTAGTMEFILYN